MTWTQTASISKSGLTSAVRLIGASVLAREAANAVTSVGRALKVPQAYQGRGSVSQTKTKTKKKMKYSKPKVSKTVAKYVKKSINKAKEVKGRSFGLSTSMIHTTIYTANVTANVVESVFDYGRIGDSIQTRHLVVNYSFIAPTTAGAYGYRILVFWSGAETASTGLSSGGFSLNQVFQPTIAGDTQFAAIPNPKAVTVLADRIININSNVASTQDMSTGMLKVNLGNNNFKYASNSSIYGKTKNLYVLVSSYVAGGVAGTTSTGIGFINYDFRYADS